METEASALTVVPLWTAACRQRLDLVQNEKSPSPAEMEQTLEVGQPSGSNQIPFPNAWQSVEILDRCLEVCFLELPVLLNCETSDELIPLRSV